MKDDIINNQRVRCYDNGGKTADRYTAVYMDQPEERARGESTPRGRYMAVGMSAFPFHPQGVGQHCVVKPGMHLGKRIAFVDLPMGCQQLIEQDTKG